MKDKQSASPQPDKKKKWSQFHQDQEAEETISNNPFYGIERQPSERAIMLDVQLESGDRKGLPYTYMGFIDYDPSEGIVIEFMEKKIKILGRNLSKLYDYFLQHRVTFIKENIGDYDGTKEEDLFIESIKMDEIQPEN